LSKNLSSRQIVSHLDKTNSQLNLSRQCELLGTTRSNAYYRPVPIDPFTLDLMNLIDEVYTDCPFYGSRKIAAHLSRELGQAINRKRVQRLMRLMGIEAIYPKPNLSKAHPDHLAYPYLLKGLSINNSNQVWGTDITYIKMAGGFLYLVAFMDWYSRYVLSWQLSTSLEADFCIEAAQTALQFATPEITNSDQGVQFTSQAYIDVWKNHDTKISMDGRGRCMDNIFTERLWRSLKYEEVYLKSYQSVAEARSGISSWFDFYNHKRVHQSLNYRTPAEIYSNLI